ncbi:MAG: hypothetical protein R3F30_12590 [Planctomycetota bacterium]
MSRRGLAVLSSILLSALAPRAVGQGAWFELQPRNGPTSGLTIAYSLAYDEARQVSVLVGSNKSTSRRETWEWDGSTWTLRYSGDDPASFNTFFYHPKWKVCVGSSVRTEAGPKYVNELWSWDGKRWTEADVDSIKGPSGRGFSAMAYEPNRGVIVMFGGLAYGAKNTLTDTWEFDGSTWKQVQTKSFPTGKRTDARMVYEPKSKQLVLFGGWSGSGELSDMWEYDGSDWTQRLTSAPKDFTGRCDPIAWLPGDQAKGVRLVWQRYSSDQVPMVTEISDWTASGWVTQGPIGSAERPMRAVQSAFSAATVDQARKQLLFIKTDAAGFETWVYGEGYPASFQVVGKGCPGSTTGPPVLGAPQPPVLGKFLELSLNGAPALSPSFLILSDRPADVDLGFLGAPGCRAYTQPLLFVGLFTDFTGRWVQNPRTPIPWHADLLDAELHAQGWVFDPKANALGLIGSNGGKLTLGF